MVERSLARQIGLHEKTWQRKNWDSDALLFLDRGAIVPASISSPATLYGYQERSFDTHDRVDGNPSRSSENGQTDREATIHHSSYPKAKYQSITAIEERYVTELPVYNLTTESGTYLAEGFLVHNCGTPTVAWPTGGNLDTICEGANGVFIDPRNPDRVEAVCLAIQQAKTLDRRVVRAWTEEHFGCPSKQAEQFEMLIEDVIGGKRW